MGCWYTEREIEAAVEAIRRSMDWRTGFGFIVDEIVAFENAFAKLCGTRHAVSLCTASVGLDLVLRCLDLKPGDEVIVPAINFKAAALAVLGQGARPVFCEVDPATLCADPDDVERRLTRNTRAILPTHMNGLSAPMNDLLAIADRHPHPTHGPLKVIGDAARACGGTYNGTRIGKMGWANVFSFQSMKLITTLGEGGMVTTDDNALAQRIRDMRQWGGSASEWGSSYKLTKVQAAVGNVQMARFDEMLGRRRELALQRLELLKGLPGVTLPVEPEGFEHAFYLFSMLVPKAWAGEKRDALAAMLRDDYGVGCAVANPPVWEGQSFLADAARGQIESLPVSADVGKRLFCPGLHPQMTDEENRYICAAVWEAVERVGQT